MVLRVTKAQADIIAPFTGRVEPLSAGTLFPPFFRPNWRTRLEVSTSWQTAVNRSQDTGAGTRLGLQERPVRTLKTTLTGLNQEESTMLQMSLLTIERFGTPFPIYTDVTTLENTLTATVTTDVQANIRYKRFYPGQRVAFVDPGFNRVDYGALGTALYGEIKDVYDSGFELIDPPDYEVPAGFDIFPLIDIHANLNIKTRLLTDNHMELSLTVLEKSGQSTLPPSWRGSPNTNTYENYPIFQIDPNYNTRVEQTFNRHGERYSQGRSTITALHSQKPFTSWRFEELALTREQGWDLLNFFDSRCGRVLPFWVISPQTNWNIKTITTTTVDIPNYDYLQNLIDLVDYIGFDTGDIRKVKNITTPDSETFRIEFEDAFTTAPSATYVTPAYLSTFMKDTFTESWYTDTVYSTRLEIAQELENKEVTIPYL